MSLISRETAAYMKVLTPIVVANGYPSSVQPDPYQTLTGSAALEFSMKQALDTVDWTSSGLAPHYIPGEEDEFLEVGAQSIARGLIKQAFEDVHDIAMHADKKLAGHGLNRSEMGGPLLRSSHLIVPIADLREAHAGIALNLLLEPPVGAPTWKGIPTATFADPMDIKGDGESLRVGWKPEIVTYLRKNRDKESGCPARSVIVDREGGKRQTLLTHLWERIVKADYDT